MLPMGSARGRAAPSHPKAPKTVQHNWGTITQIPPPTTFITERTYFQRCPDHSRIPVRLFVWNCLEELQRENLTQPASYPRNKYMSHTYLHISSHIVEYIILSCKKTYIPAPIHTSCLETVHNHALRNRFTCHSTILWRTRPCIKTVSSPPDKACTFCQYVL